LLLLVLGARETGGGGEDDEGETKVFHSGEKEGAALDGTTGEMLQKIQGAPRPASTRDFRPFSPPRPGLRRAIP
jgi:hypothetical protein